MISCLISIFSVSILLTKIFLDDPINGERPSWIPGTIITSCSGRIVPFAWIGTNRMQCTPTISNYADWFFFFVCLFFGNSQGQFLFLFSFLRAHFLFSILMFVLLFYCKLYLYLTPVDVFTATCKYHTPDVILAVFEDEEEEEKAWGLTTFPKYSATELKKH